MKTFEDIHVCVLDDFRTLCGDGYDEDISCSGRVISMHVERKQELCVFYNWAAVRFSIKHLLHVITCTGCVTGNGRF